MKIVNRIIGGVHADNDPNQQPENTMRRSVDGVIMDVGDGNYVWETITGTSISFTLPGTDPNIMGWCTMRERFIILVIDISDNSVRLYEVTFDNDGIGTLELLYFGSNAEMNLSEEHPIRAMYGFYESQEIQRIYFTDDYNPPRVLNIGYENENNKQVIIEEKFLPFSPQINHAYGNFRMIRLLNGGYLKAGTYFICWRYINIDYFSDWSYLSNPIQVADGFIGVNPDQYQGYQGQAPDEVTSKAINFELSNLDSDYESIQIAAFYSNDYNSIEPGIIFYDGELTGETMDLVYYGNELIGTVTLEEILDVSTVIDKCKDLTTIQNRNVIGNVKTRTEIDTSGLNAANKENQIDCEMELTKREVILDITGYDIIPVNSTTGVWSAGEKGLFQAPTGTIVTTSNTNMYCGIQYRGITAGGATLDEGGTIVWAIGEIFELPETETTGAICTSGSCEPVIALKKYRLASAPAIPAWDDYEWEVTSLVGQYLDYKSPTLANTIKSLPGGETIRYGLVCFDLTGRPFFARWLNNKDATLGEGDPTIPKRTYASGANGEVLVWGYDTTNEADGSLYEQLNGIALGMKFNNLDLTDIINNISGFMIVRAPIVHQFIASGLIAYTAVNAGGNEIYMYSGFKDLDGDVNKYPEVYAFHCPEDDFELKDFSIQPGDEIENLQYLRPYRYAETDTDGYGYGCTREVDFGHNLTGINPYQKMLLHTNESDPGDNNGIIGISHEVLYSTRFRIGDDDIIFDPRNETVRYKNDSSEQDGNNLKGKSGRHNIIVLDIDETTDGFKGKDNSHDPYGLFCTVKRPIANPYGGTSDSSLANTLYMACGHFQAIDDDVRNAVESGGRYIFNEIEVFGGDQFICLYGIQRILIDRDATIDQTGHGVIFAVESRINIGMREGVHFAKDRPHEPDTNTSGIKYEVEDFNLEEYNYNDGYSSEDVNDYYTSLPFNSTLIDNFDTQIRHSPQKTIGERRDQFRIFNALDKLELDSKYGELFNIKAKNNRIIYWQKDAVGYVPVNERALTQTAFGDPIQLGVGGIFERYDEMTDKVGNSNQFGLVVSDVGYHWYDAKRKMYLSLTDSMQFSKDSIVKGMNNWIEENIDTDIIDYDNPMKYSGNGICGGYDPYHKVVFHTFFNPTSGTIKTIGFDTRLQVFIGEFTMPGNWYMRFRNRMFSTPQGLDTIYRHGSGARANIYGTNLQPIIQIVVRSAEHTSLIYDSFEIIGNNQFFDQITCESSDQSVTELIQDYLAGEYRFLGRNYEYRNRKWVGNFPRFQVESTQMVNRKERMLDSYMIVTLRALPLETKFMQMTTEARKAY